MRSHSKIRNHIILHYSFQSEEYSKVLCLCGELAVQKNASILSLLQYQEYTFWPDTQALYLEPLSYRRDFLQAHITTEVKVSYLFHKHQSI